MNFIKSIYIKTFYKYSNEHSVTVKELILSILEISENQIINDNNDNQKTLYRLLDCFVELADKRRIVGREAGVLVDCLYDYYWSIEGLRNKIDILNKIYDVVSINEIETEEQKQKLLLLQNAISRIYVVDNKGVINNCTKHI